MGNKAISYVILVMLALVWGSSFILMKKGLESFQPIQIAAYRMFSAGIVLLPIFIFWFDKAKKKNYKWFFLSGLLGNALPAFMFSYAQTRLSSSLAGTLNALTPLFALLIGIVVFKLPMSFWKITGVLLGFGGALLLILMRPGDTALSGDLGYVMLLVLAAFFYGINVNIIKEKLSESRPMVVAAFPIVFMAIPATFILFFNGFFQSLHFSGNQLQSLGYLTLLSVFGTALSLIAFNRLIQMTNAVFASYTTYLMPIVALLWGVADGEEVNLWQILGLISILIGVLVVNRSRIADMAKK